MEFAFGWICGVLSSTLAMALTAYSLRKWPLHESNEAAPVGIEDEEAVDKDQ